MFEEEVDVKWATLFFFLFVFLPVLSHSKKKRKEKKSEERKESSNDQKKVLFGLSANDIFLVWVSIPHFRAKKKRHKKR